MSTYVEDAHKAFRRWLGESYDLEALDVVLSVAAATELTGDPVWLMVISGPGNAKTETVSALSGIGAHVVSTISGEAALLSGTPHKERAKNATGGLLRVIGDEGLLVVKDFTTILSMQRDQRAEVLAALREVYDGRWDRYVGTEGGLTLTWTGRVVVVAACTTAYDSAHAVMSALGDRFALVRMDSTAGRGLASRQAIDNVGAEVQMRAELSEAVQVAMATLNRGLAAVDDGDVADLVAAADLVTLARTAVECDHRGNPLWAHAPEMPTRFAKMLAQVMRGAVALGFERGYARTLAMRVARDSMPPLRLALLGDVLEHPVTPVREVVKRTQKPRTTVDQNLQKLHLLGLLHVDDRPHDTAWHYRVADGVDRAGLSRLTGCRDMSGGGPGVDSPNRSPDTPLTSKERTERGGDISRQQVEAQDQAADDALWPGGRCGFCGKPSEHNVCPDCEWTEFEEGLGQ